VVSWLGSFLGRQKEKKGEMPVVEPPETPPRVQRVATAINAEERRKLMRHQEVMVNKLRNEHIKENKRQWQQRKKAHRAARRAVGTAKMAQSMTVRREH